MVIALDCGIKAVEKVAYAKGRGVDFIICDHHVPDDELPHAVAVLDAKRDDDTYPYSHLSGCGVGFKFMQGFATSNNISIEQFLFPLLDMVAVSIASDIVPITDENRILAYHGLRRLNSNPSLGLQGIINVCGLRGKEITISDIVFKIGPRINASGRMQSGKEAVDLLVSKDASTAMKKSHDINQYNEDRKELDKKVTEEASQLLEQRPDFDDRKSIVIYNAEWHKGIIGIVDKVSEHFSSVLTVLHSQSLVSVSLASSGFSGSLSWPGIRYDEAVLSDIPSHVRIRIGEKVVTSGLSSVFPGGIPVGYVEEVISEPGEDFYRLRIRFSEDYHGVDQVYIVKDLYKAELESCRRHPFGEI